MMTEETRLNTPTVESRNRCRACIRCGGAQFEHN
nr:unnamed protein product [Callosobruchus chinensis]